MNATPLFDAIARSRNGSVVPPIVPTGYSAAVALPFDAAADPARAAECPVSVASGTQLSPALVAEIDAIPATVDCPNARVFDLDDAGDRAVDLSSTDLLALGAAGDAVIRRIVAVVDEELDVANRRRRAVADAFADRLTQVLVDTVADELDRLEVERALRRA